MFNLRAEFEICVVVLLFAWSIFGILICMKEKFWIWAVFFISIGAYVPLLIGGWKHPVEINIPTYSLFAIITAMMFFSAKAQGFTGWRLPLGWFIGNISMIGIAFIFLKGWTFNLGPQEIIILYGLAVVFGAWITLAQIQNKWNPRILFLGAILIDIASFYPLVKQYLLPHEPPTAWMLAGWFLAMVGPVISMIFVEKIIAKLYTKKEKYREFYQKEKNIVGIFEESGASMENAILYLITFFMMLH